MNSPGNTVLEALTEIAIRRSLGSGPASVAEIALFSEAKPNGVASTTAQVIGGWAIRELNLAHWNNILEVSFDPILHQITIAPGPSVYMFMANAVANGVGNHQLDIFLPNIGSAATSSALAMNVASGTGQNPAWTFLAGVNPTNDPLLLELRHWTQAAGNMGIPVSATGDGAGDPPDETYATFILVKLSS